MKKYSINKLRLDLYKLVSGPDCKHVDQSVKTIGKNVSAKWVFILPGILLFPALNNLHFDTS